MTFYNKFGYETICILYELFHYPSKLCKLLTFHIIGYSHHSLMLCIQETSIEMALYDTNSIEDINIVDAMVRAGMAQFAPAVPAVEAAACDTIAPHEAIPQQTEAFQDGEFGDHVSPYVSGVGNPTTVQEGDQSPNTPILDDKGYIHIGCGRQTDMCQRNTEEVNFGRAQYPVALLSEESNASNDNITRPCTNQPSFPCDIFAPTGVEQTDNCLTVTEQCAKLTDDATDQYATTEPDHVTEALLAMSSLSCGFSDRFSATSPDQQVAISSTDHLLDDLNYRSPSALSYHERNATTSPPSVVYSSPATAALPIDGEDTASRAHSARSPSPSSGFPPLQTESDTVFYSDE